MSVLRIDCPNCKVPGQHVNLPCGFCGHHVPVPAEAMQGIGDSATVEEVIGYRAWNVHGRGPQIRLHSPVYTYVWHPGGTDPMGGKTPGGDGWYWAQCEGAGKIGYVIAGPEHRNDSADTKLWVPVRDCGGSYHGCGFYAGRTHAHLINLGYACDDGRTVIGKIQMEGKIIPATNGFRAQKVRIETIFVPHHLWQLANDLKAVYGPQGTEVDLHTTIISQETPEWCENCGAKMPPRAHVCKLCGMNHQ
jgi:hypothetical protein